MERFQDSRESIYSFQDEFLVRCPSCDSCATVRRIDRDNTDGFPLYRFSCTACGAAKDWCDREIIARSDSEPRDDYFHYPLWLQSPCCGQTLWAYNLRHLEFIESFVRAELRERQPDDRYGWCNRSLFSRLPKWMQSAKNREKILKAIAKIRQSL
jgi:hypothetical protein